jgi:hypothetical protein
VLEDALQAIDAFGKRIANSAIGPLQMGSKLRGCKWLRSQTEFSRGWWPTGFSEDGDFRLYSYKEFSRKY